MPLDDTSRPLLRIPIKLNVVPEQHRALAEVVESAPNPYVGFDSKSERFEAHVPTSGTRATMRLSWLRAAP